MRGYARTVQLALSIIAEFASDIVDASTPNEIYESYIKATRGNLVQSLPEPIKGRTIRQIEKLWAEKSPEFASEIISSFTSSMSGLSTGMDLYNEYSKIVLGEYIAILPQPLRGETIDRLASIWFAETQRRRGSTSFGTKDISNLYFLQKLAKRNKISIFKIRKDRKGYTKILLTIPQLKSRLTRHGISYKNNRFGMQSSSESGRSYAQVAREAVETESLGAPVRVLLERVLSRIEVPAPATNRADLLEAYRLIRMFPQASLESTRAQRNLDDAERRSRSAWQTGRGGSRDIETTNPTVGFNAGAEREMVFPRIIAGRLPRWEMLRYIRRENPRDRTPTGKYYENYPTGYNIFD
jgi:hypothetical protein